jgi:hypothetical protein
MQGNMAKIEVVTDGKMKYVSNKNKVKYLTRSLADKWYI